VAAIVGVHYIPQCKMLSLVVVFTLVGQSRGSFTFGEGFGEGIE